MRNVAACVYASKLHSVSKLMKQISIVLFLAPVFYSTASQAGCDTNPLDGIGCDSIIIDTPADPYSSPVTIAPDASESFTVGIGKSIGALTADQFSVRVETPLANFNNYGTISSSVGDIAVQLIDSVNNFNNFTGATIAVSGIDAAWAVLYDVKGATNLYNYRGATISASGDNVFGAIGLTFQNFTDPNNVVTIINAGSISSNKRGIYNILSTIDTITNIGTITAGNGYAAIDNTVQYSSPAISTIRTLNNYQGAAGSGGSALTYAGDLPTNYNMIAYGDQYGQLAVDSSNYNGDGGMMFGIFGGDSANGIAASQLKSQTYYDVVTGITEGDYNNDFNGGIHAAFGSYNGVAWRLTDASWRNDNEPDAVDPTHQWDLRVLNFGLDLAEPQRAMLEQRQQAIRNGLDYDCAQFDKDGVCVSFKARYSSLSDEHEGAGVLVVSKRIDTGLRVGAFVDERVESNTVNNLKMETGMPMFGIFAAYTAGKDGTGLQARISAAYEHGKADITRENMLGSASQVSGKSDVDSYGVAQRIGWGFGLGNKNVLTPYLGIRYTEAKRAAYDEAYSAGSVIDPFSYAAYGERRTTGTIGADLDGNISKDVIYRLGGGLDYDFTNNLDTFALNSTYFGDMTYTSAEKARAVRAFGLAGLGYNFDTTKTFTLDGNVSQMDYGNDLAYNIWAGFRMGF